MREILFRGKRKDNRKWEYGSLFFDDRQHLETFGHKIGVPYMNGMVTFPVDSETVGQFTGLTDKNGVKIFEGDKIGNQRNFVEFCNGSWTINGDRPLSMFLKEEITGTIHD